MYILLEERTFYIQRIYIYIYIYTRIYYNVIVVYYIIYTRQRSVEAAAAAVDERGGVLYAEEREPSKSNHFAQFSFLRTRGLYTTYYIILCMYV